MLICNNLNLPVSLKLDVYQNVITGWTTSLRGLEDLLAGLPQRVQDGSLLLALSSWHLYPDIMVCSCLRYLNQASVLMLIAMVARSSVTNLSSSTITSCQP
jgi:hypothetical protein